MIKLIVTDMDGTLLNSKKEMPQGMKVLLKRLREQGIVFAAASGRQYYSLADTFRTWKDAMYFIAENGCMVVRGQADEVLSADTLDAQDVEHFIRILREIPGAYIIACGKKSAYFEVEEDENLMRNVRPYYAHYQQVDDLLTVDDAILKIAVLHLQGTATHVLPYVAAYQNDFSMPVSAFEWLDIMKKGVHKGNGVRQLQQLLGITRRETMAFGDFMNDYELMQEADYSFAMKNAVAEIKRVSHFVTEYTNEEAGVAREIEKWMARGWQMPPLPH